MVFLLLRAAPCSSGAALRRARRGWWSGGEHFLTASVPFLTASASAFSGGFGFGAFSDGFGFGLF